MLVDVIVPRPLPRPLTYSVPENLKTNIDVGYFVRVPFRSKSIEGFVIKVHNEKPTGDFEVKEILEAPFNQPVFSIKDFEFFSWISDYYQIPLGEVFNSAFPKSFFQIPKTTRSKGDHPGAIVKEIKRVELTGEQTRVLDRIHSAFNSKQYRSFLLFGVTGSGKTEIYLRSAQRALQENQSALVMVPEISLTPQLRNRFEDYFGDLVAVLHSSLGEKKRRDYWWDIINGKRKLVVGARSAVFAPLKNIGLIIVDEEHEPSYKQEDRLRYNARDLAMVRAKQNQALVVLGSATPSIETYYAATQGKHELLELNSRPGARQMPQIEVVDLTKEREKAKKEAKKTYRKLEFNDFFISKKLLSGLRETFERKEQAILFVNRKGFSNCLLCKDCGFVPKCPNCSVSLTYYRSSGEVKCHYCGLKTRAPDSCSECSSYELMFMGIGTERAQEVFTELFPDIRIGRLDADSASTQKKLEVILDQLRNGDLDLLIGTQMIAKGHDFPNVTFIGVLLADLNLHLPDFRSSERTFQLLTQVSGRAGRDSKPGKVVLQTLLPDHYVIQSSAKNDYLGFFKFEIEQRLQFGYPPFSKMAHIEFRHLKEAQAKHQADSIRHLLERLNPSISGFEYLGPAAASISRIANQYRWQILLKSEKSSSLNAIVKTLRKEGVRFIDVDPISTL